MAQIVHGAGCTALTRVEAGSAGGAGTCSCNLQKEIHDPTGRCYYANPSITYNHDPSHKFSTIDEIG